MGGDCCGCFSRGGDCSKSSSSEDPRRSGRYDCEVSSIFEGGLGGEYMYVCIGGERDLDSLHVRRSRKLCA